MIKLDFVDDVNIILNSSKKDMIFAYKINSEHDFSLPSFEHVCKNCIIEDNEKSLRLFFNKASLQNSKKGNIMIGAYNNRSEITTVTGVIETRKFLFFYDEKKS